jgi:hypothetical protein
MSFVADHTREDSTALPVRRAKEKHFTIFGEIFHLILAYLSLLEGMIIPGIDFGRGFETR